MAHKFHQPEIRFWPGSHEAGENAEPDGRLERERSGKQGR